MATYPSALVTLENPSQYQDEGVPHSSQHTLANEEIEAIEAELGVTPSGASATVAARLDTLDTTVAGKAATAHSHSDATTGAAGFMSASDKTKLDSVATGATANDTDANLKARDYHTGTQLAATISNFDAAAVAANASAITAAVASATALAATYSQSLAGGQLFKSSYYSYNGHTTRTTQAGFTLNRVLCVPILVPRSITLDRIACESTAGSATSTVRLGIYTSVNDYPDTLVVDGGSLSTTGTGEIFASISVTLTPGWYWLAFVQQTAAATVRAITTGVPQIPQASGAFGGSLSNAYVQNSVTGALPSTFTASVATSATAPLVGIRVA